MLLFLPSTPGDRLFCRTGIHLAQGTLVVRFALGTDEIPGVYGSGKVAGLIAFPFRTQKASVVEHVAGPAPCGSLGPSRGREVIVGRGDLPREGETTVAAILRRLLDASSRKHQCSQQPA